MSGKKLIVGISGRDGGQTWYRLMNPLRVLEEAGVADCPIVCLGEEEDDYSKLPELVAAADLVIWQNAQGEAAVRWIRAIQNDFGVPVAVDLDDNNFCVTPENESYRVWGRKKHVVVLDPERRKILEWTEGKWAGDTFYLPKANRGRLRTHLQCMREATALICSTFRLAAVSQRFKGWVLNKPGQRFVPSYLCPNMIDSRTWPNLNIIPNRPTVRILWQGGSSHMGDLLLVKRVLGEILVRFPETRLVILGGPSATHYLTGFPKHQVEIHDTVKGGDEYRKKLAELDCDIGLAPLMDTPFNRCKSAVKWLQYTMAGMATIASDVPPYSDNISMDGPGHEWNGVLAGTTEEWLEGLTQLVKSAEMRFTLVRNARKWTRAHGDIRAPQVLENLCNLYEVICGLPDHAAGARDPARTPGG